MSCHDTPFPPSDFPEQPPRIPGYSFERDLERGVVGCVWLYRRDHDGAPFACKSPRNNPVAIERFRRETNVIRRLNHPHVIRIVKSADEPNGPWHLTHHYPKGTLRTLLGRGPMPWGQLVRGASGLLDGLSHAHERDVIHRDVKPANVLIRSASHWVLADWGLARVLSEASTLTEFGTFLGTRGYVGPEQQEGLSDQADKAWDTYAVGCLLNALARGWGQRVPARLGRVIDRCLAPRDRRYPDAQALRADLRRLAG
jgi:serine/threonine protein kinase